MERLAQQSPLKSGPSTVNGGGSTYESPQKIGGALPELTSSIKKHMVPPLDFARVFEQQRLILQQEEKRKIEEQKRQAHLKKQQENERAY